MGRFKRRQRRRLTRRQALAAMAVAGVTAAEARADPVNVSVSVPDDDGLGLRGIMPVTVSAEPLKNLTRVELYIDDALALATVSSPLIHQWDTTKVVDGTHILRGEARYKMRRSKAQIAVTTLNTTPPPLPPWTGGGSLPAMKSRPTGTVRLVQTASEFASALASVNSGEIIQLKGTIVGQFTITRPGPYWIESAPGERATVTGPSAAPGTTYINPIRIESGTRDISMRSFNIRGAQAKNADGYGSMGIYLKNCSDVEMVDLDIHSDVHTGIDYPRSGVMGIFSEGGSSNCRAWYCNIWMNGQSFPSDHSWYMEGSGHWMIGCLAVRHDWGYGMQAYHGGSSTDPSNCRIVNCTFVGSKKSSITLYGTGNKAINCICMDNAEYGARIDRPGNEIRDSIVWDPATTYNPGGGTFTRIATVDPALVNGYALVDNAHPPVPANYKPQAGSPAIGKADPAFCPSLLLDGTPRISADIGCM